MTIFDAAFIDTVWRKDVHEFDAWVKRWGVACVVERTRKHEHMADKGNWVKILLGYPPTMQKWMASDLCAQTDAEYMFDHLFDQLINVDHNGALSKKCKTSFAKHMFTMTHQSLWQKITQIVGQHHNELLLHIVHHPEFNTYLISERNVAQEGMRDMFSKMIVGSRNVEDPSWNAFCQNMPPYNRSWLVPYIDSLLVHRFENVVIKLLESDTFQQWNANGEFLKEWAQRHTLTLGDEAQKVSFLDPATLPIFYGTLLWNTIAHKKHQQVDGVLKKFDALTVPIENILVHGFVAAERSVKNLSVDKKERRLRQVEDNLVAIFDDLSDQTLDNLIAHKTVAWDWCNISNHPRVVSRVLHTALATKGRTSGGRKI